MVYNDRDSTERHSFLGARKLPYFQSGPSESQLNYKHKYKAQVHLALILNLRAT